MHPSPSRVARRHLQARMDPFKAIQKATLEVWGKKQDYKVSELRRDFNRWLQEGDPSGRAGDRALASVFHEYATAPPEPFNYFQGSGPDNDLKTWNRVADRAGQLAGMEILIESVNSAVSAFYPDTPWP